MVDIAILIFCLSALLLIGNLLLRVIKSRQLQFGFNFLILILLIGSFIYTINSSEAETILNVLSINSFSLFFGLIFTSGLFLINLLGFTYSESYEDFAAIASFTLLGMYAVAMSTSLITIFIGLELSTLPVVFIILLSRHGIEAAAKLFIMAAIAIALLSFAIVLTYGASNSFALNSYTPSTILSFAALLFLVSLGFEASVFPFNVLIPDIYTGSPAYVTGMLGGINKKVGFAALIQVLILVFIASKPIFLIVAVLSVLTMFYGNIVALIQKNTKRMLAYSSISQAGYMLIGIAVANNAGITATLFQVFSHMFIFIGLMGVIALLEAKNRVDIDDLIGFSAENRVAAFALAIFMLSLIGLPLTTGFVGKFLLFLSAINANLVWLAVIGIVNTAISVFYYVRAIIAMYTSKEGTRKLIMGRPLYIVIIICVLITLLFGIYPDPIYGLANSAAGYIIP